MFEIHDRGDIRLRMKVSDEVWSEFRADNLFKCLLDARLELERRNLLLCCQGARPDVFPSGMQQQMWLGRFAGVLSDDGEEVVDIFAPAEPAQVGSVEEQRVAVFRFHNLPLRDPSG